MIKYIQGGDYVNREHAEYYRELVLNLSDRVLELEAQLAALQPKPTVVSFWVLVGGNDQNRYCSLDDAVSARGYGEVVVRHDWTTHPDGTMTFAAEVCA